jgi:hypothetical protein
VCVWPSCTYKFPLLVWTSTDVLPHSYTSMTSLSTYRPANFRPGLTTNTTVAYGVAQCVSGAPFFDPSPSQCVPIRPLPGVPSPDQLAPTKPDPFQHTRIPLSPTHSATATTISSTADKQRKSAGYPCPSMPDHWKSDFESVWPWLRPLLKFVFTVFVMIAFGQESLEQKWEKARLGDNEFQEDKNRISARISMVTVVVSKPGMANLNRR